MAGPAAPVWADILRIRERAPLVLNITNYVVMNNTANALLAAGASPIMAHAPEEVRDLVAISGALVVNIGTLSEPWVKSMKLAGKAALRRGVPAVLDPVGCGATPYRTRTALALLRAMRPAIVRGNASEILALLSGGGGTKGVDSVQGPEDILREARALARSAGCVVCVSGPVDLVVDGRREARIANGDPIMTRVTGMGCTASALCGAFLAASPTPFDAATHAMALMGVAGEIAASRAKGPGSFQVSFLDALYALTRAQLGRRLHLRQDAAR
jgi:hydroxyethylthiazole kinase